MTRNPNSDTPGGYSPPVDVSGEPRITAGQLRAAGYFVDWDIADDQLPRTYCSDHPNPPPPPAAAAEGPKPEAPAAEPIPPRKRGRWRKA